MADITHEGGSGWIPGCPCPQCEAGLAAAKQRMAAARNDETTSGWADEPLSLRALAVALEHLAGPEPDVSTSSEDLDRWFTRWDVASDILTEVSNMDAAVLLSAAGPEVDDPPVGHRLFIAAAIRLDERRPR